MSSPRINPLDDWLRSGPGCIFGISEIEALNKAHGLYIEFGGKLDYDLFCHWLKSAGYLPCPQCKNWDTGQYETRLQLPERVN